MGEGIITAHRTNCVSKRLVCSFAQERQADGEVGIGETHHPRKLFSNLRWSNIQLNN